MNRILFEYTLLFSHHFSSLIFSNAFIQHMNGFLARTMAFTVALISLNGAGGAVAKVLCLTAKGIFFLSFHINRFCIVPVTGEDCFHLRRHGAPLITLNTLFFQMPEDGKTGGQVSQPTTINESLARIYLMEYSWKRTKGVVPDGKNKIYKSILLIDIVLI